MVWIAAIGVGVLAAVVMAVVVPRVRIDDDEEAPDFAALVSRRSVLGVGVLGVAVAQVLWVQPAWTWWLWVPYLGVGAAMAYVDWRTTFLPRLMNNLALGLMAVGGVAVGVADWRALVGAVVGALAAYGLLYAAWRLSPGLGFGDVRLALLIGAVAGQLGASMWALSLFLGTALGAVHAVVHAVWARRGEGRPTYFPYGPALWLGPVAAAVWMSVL